MISHRFQVIWSRFSLFFSPKIWDKYGKTSGFICSWPILVYNSLRIKQFGGGSGMKTYRIAIVDDDTNIRQIVEAYLQKEGYRTVKFAARFIY
jgi:hypothetical protein